MRILIPLLALLLGVAVALGVLSNTKPNTPGTPGIPDATPAAETRSGDAPGTADASTDNTTTSTARTPGSAGSPSNAETATPSGFNKTPETAASVAPATASATPDAATGSAESQTGPTEPTHTLDALRVVPAKSPQGITLGGLDPDGPFRLEVSLTSYGAGLRKLQLADYTQRIEGDERYTLIDPLQNRTKASFFPLAAKTLTLGQTTLGLNAVAWTADNPVRTDQAQSVTYRAAVVDADNHPVGEIVRTWTVRADSYDVQLDQHFINRSGQPLSVRFEQYGVGDILMDQGAYVGDRRMFIVGYFRPENPPKTNIYTAKTKWMRSSLVKENSTNLWPEQSPQDGAEYAWVAAENRYFAMVMHLPLPATAPTADGVAELRTADVSAMQSRFPNLGVRTFHLNDAANTADVITTLGTAAMNVAPGGEVDLSLNVFAGPRRKELLTQQPYAAMQLEQLIRYELGCTWCTFQFLAHGLLGYLKFLHNYIVFDWGVAIILLVVTVRLLLHPITKRAQTNMMKMSKQMAAIQPDMKKIKEKFKDDPTKMNAEVMKLYREKGVNPAGFLGCAPMLLQTPIWIALYATLYYAIELRHQPAFYGVFQAVSDGRWKFLADLSVADHFIKFPGEGFKLNLLLVHPTFAAINILPLLMAVAFFVNMKFTTPPAQTPEQQQQQKIMRIMPFIFPIFLYSAPSGLTLYICASTLAGIFDSYIVRKHIREQEEAGTLFDKKEVKPGSLKWKLQQRMKMASEMAAARMEEQQKRKQVENTAGSKNCKNRKRKN